MELSNYMNAPEASNWAFEDIIKEYMRFRNTRKVLKIWGITVKEVNEILKQYNILKK